jgi:hypothetical protein
VLQNEPGRGLQDITYIHMLSLLATGLRDEFHGDMVELVSQTKEAIMQQALLFQLHHRRQSSTGSNGSSGSSGSSSGSGNSLVKDGGRGSGGISAAEQAKQEKKSLTCFLDAVQYRAAPIKTSARMLERLEQWQQENVAASVGALIARPITLHGRAMAGFACLPACARTSVLTCLPSACLLSAGLLPAGLPGCVPARLLLFGLLPFDVALCHCTHCRSHDRWSCPLSYLTHQDSVLQRLTS